MHLSNFLQLTVRIVVLVVLFLIILFPFYWLISNAFKMEQEYYHSPPIMFPSKFWSVSFEGNMMGGLW